MKHSFRIFFDIIIEKQDLINSTVNFDVYDNFININTFEKFSKLSICSYMKGIYYNLDSRCGKNDYNNNVHLIDLFFRRMIVKVGHGLSIMRMH